MRPLREAVKRLVEGVLVLCCAMLVVTMVEGAMRIWQPHHQQATLLGWIAAVLPAGALTVKLSTRLWVAPTSTNGAWPWLIPIVIAVLSGAWLARWPVGWRRDA